MHSSTLINLDNNDFSQCTEMLGLLVMLLLLLLVQCLPLQCHEFVESVGDCFSGITPTYQGDPLSECDYTVATLDDDVYESDLHKFRVRECLPTDDICTSAWTYLEGEIRLAFGEYIYSRVPSLTPSCRSLLQFNHQQLHASESQAT